jgi:hypothetical protein
MQLRDEYIGTSNPVPGVPSVGIITLDNFLDSFRDVVEEQTSEFEAEPESDDDQLVQGVKKVMTPPPYLNIGFETEGSDHMLDGAYPKGQRAIIRFDLSFICQPAPSDL